MTARFLLPLAAAAALFAPPAHAQQNRDSAGRIISQPARDVGAQKSEIPEILIEASEGPYNPSGVGSCAAIASEIAALSAEIGTDYGVETAGKSNAEKVAATGGRLAVNSLIPFRNVVREISGAAAADRRMEAAVNAGLARRGFLRGLQSARGCSAR